jgi:prophage regulatory protein
MMKQLQSALTILRRKQVEARTGLSRSSIYAFVAAGKFPAPVSLGDRAVGWLESEVNEWIAGRIAASRKEA